MRTFFLIGLLWLVGIPSNAHAQHLNYSKYISDELKQLVEQDLSVLFSIKAESESALFLEVWGELEGANLQTLMLDSFDKVKTVKNGCGKGLVCLVPWYPKSLILNSNYYPGVEPQVARFAQYLWAARAKLVNPVKCPDPYLNENGENIVSMYNGNILANTRNCDDSVKGPYAAIAIFLRNVSQYCSSCSEDTKNSSMQLSEYYLERVIDASAKEQILNDL